MHFRANCKNTEELKILNIATLNDVKRNCVPSLNNGADLPNVLIQMVICQADTIPTTSKKCQQFPKKRNRELDSMENCFPLNAIAVFVVPQLVISVSPLTDG